MTDSDEINRSFAVTGPARLTLRNVDGSVDIAAGDADMVSVRAFRHPGPGADHTEIEITQDADGRVSVVTHYLEDLIARLFHPRQHGPARVDYTIRLPKDCEVDVAFVSGPARLQGLAGVFTLRSVSGAMDLADLAGRLTINTVSGPVTAARVRLDSCLTLDTVSAEVAFSDSFVPAIAAHTVSGPVRLETGLGAGPYQFRSVSGDVWLALPAGAGCQVDMHSLSGRVRASLPASRGQVNGGWKHVAFGSGGPDVSCQSVSGDLHIVTPGSQPEAEAPDSKMASPISPTPAPADRMAILDRLERGEMSVDEALSTLTS